MTIGVFDSGIGGLSVLRHLQTLLPHEDLLYVADQIHVPYGARSLAEIRQFSEGVTRFFLTQQVKMSVVACNTASAAALSHLRNTFPDAIFVGMEPAVKPAALHTRSGKVGVMATAGTFKSQRYASLMARYGRDIELFENPCRGLVTKIEAGELSTPATKQLLHSILQPMLDIGVDTLVLGCTHYPFVMPSIEEIVTEGWPATAVTIIDPAPAVARQTQRLLQKQQLLIPKTAPGKIQLLTTGDDSQLTILSRQLLGQEFIVRKVRWQNDYLICSE